MASEQQPLAINPGKGLGWFLLGASFTDVLHNLEDHLPILYPRIKIQTSPSSPLANPLCIFLPDNGLRLRFDGIDQRLRLIEVLDFSKLSLTYKGQDLIKNQEGEPATGPSFKHVYHKLFGPTFEGEKIAGPRGTNQSLYILSYPGVAFSFDISNRHSGSDFVSVLSSPTAPEAVAMSIFNGSSWKDARKDLYTRQCPHPRSLALSVKGKELQPDEIELAVIRGHGVVEFRRRTQAPFILQLGETTPQELFLTLGVPDNIYNKHDRRLSIHKGKATQHGKHNMATTPPETDRESLSTTATEYSNDDDDDEEGSTTPTHNTVEGEYFYNYYTHGFDILISTQLNPSPPLRPSKRGSSASEEDDDDDSGPESSLYPVATKLILWGNTPGLHFFGRHRRSRWILDPAELSTSPRETLTSETPYSRIRERMTEIWASTMNPASGDSQTPSTLLQRGMVLNRGWCDSPGSSVELLGGFEDGDSVVIGSSARGKAEQTQMQVPSRNTRLFGWPGLLFEVHGDNVEGLTIY